MNVDYRAELNWMVEWFGIVVTVARICQGRRQQNILNGTNSHITSRNSKKLHATLKELNFYTKFNEKVLRARQPHFPEFWIDVETITENMLFQANSNGVTKEFPLYLTLQPSIVRAACDYRWRQCLNNWMIFIPYNLWCIDSQSHIGKIAIHHCHLL